MGIQFIPFSYKTNYEQLVQYYEEKQKNWDQSNLGHETLSATSSMEKNLDNVAEGYKGDLTLPDAL